MRFRDLHEALRLEIVHRLDLGLLTGSELARLTGFRQAHISNFLHAKRSLSLTGLDRVLAAIHLTVDDVMSGPHQPASHQPGHLSTLHAGSGPGLGSAGNYDPASAGFPSIGSGSTGFPDSGSASIPGGGFLMESPALPGGPRRNEDIALDLLKFVAASTGLGRSGPASTGFTAASSAKPEDQITQLLDLYARCLKTVEGASGH